MKGKQTCKILKQIRRDIAKANDINLTIADCKHRGDCAGTCPRCESEVRALERALAERKRRGLSVTLAGISAGVITAGMVSCDTPIGDAVQGDMRAAETDEYTLEGDIIITEEQTDGVMMPPDTTELVGTVEVELMGDVPLPEDYGIFGEDEKAEADKPEKSLDKEVPRLAGALPLPEDMK